MVWVVPDTCSCSVQSLSYPNLVVVVVVVVVVEITGGAAGVRLTGYMVRRKNTSWVYILMIDLLILCDITGHGGIA